MVFPTYVDVSFAKKEELSGGKIIYHFTAFIQGYKINTGFKISKTIYHSLPCHYRFIRYGWTSGMLQWRNKDFKDKSYYLERFLMESDAEKIDRFLTKDRHVLLEKTYEWPSAGGRHLTSFDR